METGVSEQPGQESVLDFLAVPVLRVEETGRVLFANAAARALPFSLEAPTPGAVLDASGEPLPPELGPVSRAARGEPLEGELFHWKTPEGNRSVASHELKSPITALQLVLERLQRNARREVGFSGVQLAERLEPALRQVRRLGVLVQNLLDVSRARSNHFDLDRERFELGSLLREVCERFTEQARHVGSELTLEDCPPVEVHWDRLRVEQALSNLITNAIKYGAGGPISVRVERRDGVVLLQVADRGIGVAEDDQERIFNPFERAASAHRVQSLGLGLYIVREIARAHGGTVGLTGRDGGGSCFTLRLPVEEEAEGYE